MNRNMFAIRSYILLASRPQRCFCTKIIKDNEPIKFSATRAAQRGVINPIRRTNPDNMPWYQPHAILGSLAVFLIYFCVLREENDVDEQFTKTLYERIDGLEKAQLIQTYKYNMENGISVQDIERRLKEIEDEEKVKALQS